MSLNFNKAEVLKSRPSKGMGKRKISQNQSKFKCNGI